MAKRGERSSHRVRFRWANGVGGAKAFTSLDRAEDFARSLQERADLTGVEIEIRIEERQ